MLENVIIQGDCLELMKDIPNGSIDMILADLPYGTTNCSWDTIIPFDKLWEQYERVIKDNGAIVLFGSEPFSSYLRLSNIKIYRYDWIWEKSKASNFLLAKKQPLKAHEDILLFYKKQPTYNPQKTKGIPYNKGVEKRNHVEVFGKIGNGNLIINENGERYPRSVIYFKTAEFDGVLHPTQKPVELFEYLIKTYTNENEIVLDNTAGSCTTAIACLNTNRKYICMEKEQKYVNFGIQRVSEWKQKENVSKNIKKLF